MNEGDELLVGLAKSLRLDKETEIRVDALVVLVNLTTDVEEIVELVKELAMILGISACEVHERLDRREVFLGAVKREAERLKDGLLAARGTAPSGITNASKAQLEAWPRKQSAPLKMIRYGKRGEDDT